MKLMIESADFMNNWYKVDKIDNGTYVISEPNHWEHTNMYYLIGEDRNLLIDSGLGIYPLKSLLLDIDDKPIDVVTTHVHWDHIGSHGEFNNIYLHKNDSKWLRDGLPIPSFIIKEQVIKDVDKSLMPDGFNVENYSVFTSDDCFLVDDGYTFNLGGRKIKVIHTPGHSPGHICLYEEESGFLFTGDILYKGTIYCHYPSTDPVLLHKSIKRISELDVNKVLPGHNVSPLSKVYISKITKLFENIVELGKLEHGAGIFANEDVSVQL